MINNLRFSFSWFYQDLEVLVSNLLNSPSPPLLCTSITISTNVNFSPDTNSVHSSSLPVLLSAFPALRLTCLFLSPFLLILPYVSLHFAHRPVHSTIRPKPAYLYKLRLTSLRILISQLSELLFQFDDLSFQHLHSWVWF